jgi:hypothetical protein
MPRDCTELVIERRTTNRRTLGRYNRHAVIPRDFCMSLPCPSPNARILPAGPPRKRLPQNAGSRHIARLPG